MCLLSLTALLNNDTLTIFVWLILVVDYHLLKLIQLKSFHKYLLLLLKLKLFLGVRILQGGFSHVSGYVIQILLPGGRVINCEPNRTLARSRPFHSVSLMSTDIDRIAWVHFDSSAIEAYLCGSLKHHYPFVLHLVVPESLG